MGRFIPIIILCFLASYLKAFKSCDDPALIQEYELLKSKKDASYGTNAYEVADSLLNLILKSGLKDCNIAYKIRLIKGEAIELAFEFERALEYYYKLIADTEKLGYDDITAETFLCLGRVHERLERPLACKRNLLAAKTIIQKNDLNSLYSLFASRFASYHRIFESRDSAELYAHQAVEFGEKYENKRSVVDGHLLLGIVSENSDSKLFHFSQARDLFLSQGSFIGAAYQSLNISKLLFDTDQSEIALSELDSSLSYIKKHPYQNKDYYYLFHKAFNQKKEYFIDQNQLDSAIHYLELDREYQIKALQYQDQENINEIETTNAILIEQNKAAAIDRERKLLWWSVIFGAAALILLFVLYTHNIRNKKKIDKQNSYIRSQNDKLNQSLKDKTVLLSEIHHRVKNNLQMIISLLVLQAEKSSDPAVREQFADISDKIYSIALIHEQLYKEGNFDRIDLESYLKDLVSHYQNIFKLSDNFSINLNLNKIYLNLETVIPLGIIISELLSNSIKYGGVDYQLVKIDITFTQDGDNYTLKFKDNGPGYLENKLEPTKESMGALLIYSMTSQLKAQASSYNDNGAVFELKFTEKRLSII